MRTPTPVLRLSLVTITLPLVLSGCFGAKAPSDATASSSSSSSSDIISTPNVSYTGVVRPLEASVYMEGTHKLVQVNGAMILLSAADQGMDLDTYIGDEVEVQGSVRPTVEGDATLMLVTEVTVLSEEESSSSQQSSATFCGGIAGIGCPAGFECVDNPDDSCDPAAGGADCGGMCVAMAASSAESLASSSSVSVTASSSKPIPPPPNSSAAVSSVSSSADVMIRDLEAAITLMAKQDYSSSLWTQQYCTGHIAFCIPAHKNWYYKSFGATTSNLWHVEFAMESIENLGMGPIVLNLVDGTVEAVSATDGSVQTKGQDVIGFKSWTDDTHFEIIADARLQAAVTYMISHITPYIPAP